MFVINFFISNNKVYLSVKFFDYLRLFARIFSVTVKVFGFVHYGTVSFNIGIDRFIYSTRTLISR